jgi:ketosteroid isomerase-like protein
MSDDVEVVKRIYAAMAARDIETLASAVDEAVVITQDERLPWGGRFEGHPGFLDFVGKLTGAITSHVTTSAIFEADGEVIQVGRTAGIVNASGAEFDIVEVHRWVIRDGKAVKAHFAVDTQAFLDALAKET